MNMYPTYIIEYAPTQFSFDALGISESSITQCTTTLVGNIPTYKYVSRRFDKVICILIVG